MPGAAGEGSADPVRITAGGSVEAERTTTAELSGSFEPALRPLLPARFRMGEVGDCKWVRVGDRVWAVCAVGGSGRESGAGAGDRICGSVGRKCNLSNARDAGTGGAGQAVEGMGGFR